MREPTLTTGVRVCLVPDLDGALTAALDQIEELLLHIACWIEENGDEAVPAPVGDGTALAALRRISDAVRPTQGDGDWPRLLAPDGRYEHVPLRPATVDQADLVVLDATAGQLRDAASAGGWGLIAEAVEAAAGYLPVDSGEDLVNRVVRLHRLLVIEPAADTRPVWSRLAAACAVDVVLTDPEEIAYQHLVDQIMNVWCPGDLLARWLY